MKWITQWFFTLSNPLVRLMQGMMSASGRYYRHYLSITDHAGRPFDRATSGWIRTVSDGGRPTVSFGSTDDPNRPGRIYFLNAPFPPSILEARPGSPGTLGAGCEKPFRPERLFNVSGMGTAILSSAAVDALAKGARLGGMWLNTGENGFSRDMLERGCDLVFQIGHHYHRQTNDVREADGSLNLARLREMPDQVRAYEIKLSQGAKPARSAVLPVEPREEEMARYRREYADCGQLLESVARIRDATGRPVGFKTAAGAHCFADMVCEEILRRGREFAPDFITIDGGDGGSGRALHTLAEHVGLPIGHSLPWWADKLSDAGLRERISLVASGGLVDSARVAWALSLGADFVCSARGFMLALGCIQSLRCETGHCPTGVAKRGAYPHRTRAIRSKAESVAAYGRWVNHEIDTIARSCGLNNATELSRQHVAVVTPDGRCRRLDEIYRCGVSVEP